MRSLFTFGLSLAVASVASLAVACDTCGCKGSEETAHEVSHAEGEAHLHDIVDTAVEAGGFSTLVAAVQKAGLVETLKGDGPFTVFAPTDEAFAKLPEGTLESLTVEDLTNILTYHVVPAKVMKETAVTLSEAPTVNGKAAPIELKDGDAYIAGAKIVATDIECTNGVIHVVDTVMMP